jgi:Flp pilus assembly protein TadD
MGGTAMREQSDCLARGLEAFKDEDFETAVSELEQATMTDHEDFSAFIYLGAAYVRVGRVNAAIGAFKKAEELRPMDARVHYNLGQAYEAAGVPKEAGHEYAQALRINPYYTNARTALITLRSRMINQRGSGMQIAA